MFTKKVVLSLAAGVLLTAAVPVFAQHWWSDGYRYGNRGLGQVASARGLTFEHWAAMSPSPYGMTWGQILARDAGPDNDFGEGEKARLAEAQALYESAGGTWPEADGRRGARRGWRF